MAGSGTDGDRAEAGRPTTMLVVDDDEMMADLVTSHFRGAGYEVRSAGSGDEALALMEVALPDVVLCDRRMPGLSGADLLQAIRARDAAWQRVAFVFLTGLSDHRDRMSMLPLRPDGYICKPVDFRSAARDVIAAIEHARARVAVPQG